MRKIIFRGSGKTVGTDFAEAQLVPDNITDEQLSQYAYDISVENAQMYGWDLVDDYSENEYEHEVTSDDLEYYWEEYDPEEHDGLRIGGGSFEDTFALQMEQLK